MGFISTFPLTVFAEEKNALFEKECDTYQFWNRRVFFADTYEANLLPEHFMTLRNNLSNTEWKVTEELVTSKQSGCCVGFSITAMLGAYDLLNPLDFYDESELDLRYPSNKIISFPYREWNGVIRPEKSLIVYYQMLQCTEAYRQMETYQFCAVTEDEKIEKMIASLQTGKPVLLGISGYFNGKSVSSGHAVTAYSSNVGNWTFGNKTYDYEILLYDSAIPPEESWDTIPPDYHSWNFYYNSKEKIWYMPYYQLSSENGAIGVVIDDINLLNEKGVLNGTAPYVSDYRYIDVLTTNRLESEAKVTTANSNGRVICSEEGIYNDANDVDFFFPDGEGSYQLMLDRPQELTACQYYEHNMLKAYAENAEQVSVNPESVSIHENTGNYKLEMVCNEGYYSGSWYEITVSGSAKTAEILKEEKGYLLSADNLKDVKVKVRNDTDISFLNLDAGIFSADDLEHILFSETRNGILSASNLAESLSLGDLDGNQIVNAKDAALILMASANVGAGNASGITGTQEMASDINFDEKFNAVDAALILQYSASVGSGSFSGTLTEFIESK